MNGILASVVSSLVVATGAAGVALQNDPSLPFSFGGDPADPVQPVIDQVDNITEGLPAPPTLPGQDDNSTEGNSTDETPPNETDDGSDDDGAATGGCSCNETDEQPEEEPEDEGDGGCDEYDEYNETTPACGYHVDDHAWTVGAESATWQWEVTDSIASVYIYVYAGGQAQGLLGEESSVRLLDPKGRVIAQATDSGGILDDGLWLELQLDRSDLKMGAYRLELDSEYVAGEYYVHIEAYCDA